MHCVKFFYCYGFIDFIYLDHGKKQDVMQNKNPERRNICLWIRLSHNTWLTKLFLHLYEDMIILTTASDELQYCDRLFQTNCFGMNHLKNNNNNFSTELVEKQ